MRRQWYRLDNAALIFPAVMRRNWNNVFRVSVTLKEQVDPAVLNRAIGDLRTRFPTIFVKLRKGFFWYYLETVDQAPEAEQDYAWPLTPMTQKALRKCCVRILYYENRIAAEFFHSVTDGTGGMVFLKNLAARYLTLKEGVEIPAEGDLVRPEEEPKAEETRDCFQLCGAKKTVSRAEENAYRLRGNPEEDRFLTIVTGILPAERLLEKAHAQQVTVTAYLAAVLAEAVLERQREEPGSHRRRHIKITIPVNLRRIFGLNTFRNFTLAVNIGFDPALGEYTHEEICRLMYHQLAAETIRQRMAGRVTANVDPQRNLFLRLIPLPFKTMVMRLVYYFSGESKGCLNLSNMGELRLPETMAPYVERFDFIIGVQYSYPNNCSVVTWQGKTYISMIRGIRDSELERLFFSRLVEEGIPVEIESNGR
ncbi:MAG: hypothetical protein IKQ45_01070 [Clostridia bacterium]|nr:hypothetical protein [Clostridia bacterium]